MLIIRTRRCAWQPLLTALLAAPLLAAAAQTDLGWEQKDPWRFSGSASFRLGVQQTNPDSIFDPEVASARPGLVSEKIGLSLRASQAERFSLLFDAQAERRPHADLTISRVNQFYLAVDLSNSVRLRVGKQRVLWGRGLTYIPTDFINPPLDPSGLDLAKVGVPAVSLDYVADTYSLTALTRREGGGNTVNGYGLKFATSIISGLDVDLIYYQAPSIDEAVGASFAFDVGQRVHDSLGGLVISGGAAVHRKSRYPELLHANLGGVPSLEPAALGRRGTYTSWMLASNYEVNDRLSLTAEYYRIGDAYRRQDFQDIQNCLGNRASACRALSAAWYSYLAYGRNQREYYTLSVSMGSITDGRSRFTDTLGADLSMLRGVGDQSSLVTFAMKSNYWDQAEITWRNFFPVGRRNTEFGSAPYRWYSEIAINIGF